MKQDNFANRLKSAMNLRGLKQIDIVNKTKIDKTLLNKYLKGISEPKQDNLSLLAEMLDVNEIWLMGYDVPMEKESFNETNSLESFLMNLNYDDIENKVKNDKNKKIISYLDFDDILLNIYSDKLEELSEKMIQEFEKYNKCFNDISRILNKAKKENEFCDEELNKRVNNLGNILNSEMILAKKLKLYSMIKKYYSKKDILKELDSRKLFEINFDDNRIINEDERLKLIEQFLNHLLEIINNQQNKDK